MDIAQNGINIAYSADENYAWILRVAVLSVILVNDSPITFFIIDNGLSPKSRRDLLILVEKYGQNIIFVTAEDLTGKLNVAGDYPLASYSRLFLTNISCIEKILYLDCDTLVVTDLKELWNTCLNGNLIGGVTDTVSFSFIKGIGLESDDCYVNAGVLLMDLKAMREFHWNEKVLSFIKKYHGDVPHHDQGIVNSVARGGIQLLPPKYDVLDLFFTFSFEKMQSQINSKWIYSEAEYEEATKNPVILHFTTGFNGRPWDVKCVHPYKDFFLETAKKAGYDAKDILVDIPENRHGQFVKKLYEICPFWLYLALTGMLDKIRWLRWKWAHR